MSNNKDQSEIMDSFTKADYIITILEMLNKSDVPLTLENTLNKRFLFDNEMKMELQSLHLFLLKNELAEIAYYHNSADAEIYKTKYQITEKGAQSLVENDLINLVLVQDFKDAHPEIYDEELWKKHYDEKVEKRANQADFFFDIIISEKLLNLEKPEIRKYFKQWFWETQPFDVQIKNGDFAIEDGDIQIVPDFNESNIPEFIKWFENKKDNFLNYLKEQDINIIKNISASSQIINNSGNLIINEQSKITQQSIENAKTPDSIWTKANVITAIVVGIATIIGVILTIFK
ncbi:MAG: hypothetical protein AB7E26_01870 [Chryseobacterium sp.]